MARKKVYNVTPEKQKLIEQYASVREANKRSPVTIRNESITLSRLGYFLGEKPFEQATEEDLQKFFSEFDNLGSRDIIGLRVIQFYRWLFKLNKREIPKNMYWFQYSTSKQRQRVKDPNTKKHLITTEEYNNIIRISGDAHGMWQAMWETFYLSGGRVEEIHAMKIKDVIVEGGNVLVRLYKSKTKPREVPLPEKPNLLLRWLNNHPFKNNPDSPLWISYANKTYHQPLAYHSITIKFFTIKKHAEIKKTITLQCFRKTRATIMFGEGYDDTEMAQFFGWEPHTVIERRLQYDLRDDNDLKQKIFKKTTGRLETYDTIKQEKELLEQKHSKEIENLKTKLKDLTQVYEHDKSKIANAYENRIKQLEEKMDEKIEKYFQTH